MTDPLFPASHENHDCPRSANREAVFNALANANIVKADVRYAGLGDSGSSEGVDFTTAANLPLSAMPDVELPVIQRDFVDGRWHECQKVHVFNLDEAVTDLAMAYVEDLHRGWENGDGGEGHVFFDVRERTIRVEHTTFFTDSSTEETLV